MLRSAAARVALAARGVGALPACAAAAHSRAPAQPAAAGARDCVASSAAALWFSLRRLASSGRASAQASSSSSGGGSRAGGMEGAPLFKLEALPPALCGQELGGAAGGGDSGVRLLTLNNTQGSLNSLTVEMAAQFKVVFKQLLADTGMRALVITGAGRAFSAGGDFNFIEDRIAGDVADNERVLRDFYTTFLSLRRLPVPTIAAINGAAVGGGAGLAMACDMRMASSAAKISFNFVKLGLTPGMASATVVPAAVGHQVACRLLLTGDLVGAQEAKELGLVMEVVEPDQLLPAAAALAGRIAAASPSAVAATLRMLRGGLAWPALEAAAGKEAAAQARFFKGADCREGVDSVRGKRPASFGPSPAKEPYA